jgi:hypothetical protein
MLLLSLTLRMFLWYPQVFARDLGQAAFPSRLCYYGGFVVCVAFSFVVGLGVMI